MVSNQIVEISLHFFLILQRNFIIYHLVNEASVRISIPL
jgi:hypothetical protein